VLPREWHLLLHVIEWAAASLLPLLLVCHALQSGFLAGWLPHLTCEISNTYVPGAAAVCTDAAAVQYDVILCSSLCSSLLVRATLQHT
jgi:hypothetical protein